MGIGFEFGPPRADLRVPTAAQGWFSDRRLSEGQQRELERLIEDRGGMEDDYEAFEWSATGGWLNKPSRDEDVLQRQWDLICEICDFAGWIVIADGRLEYGGKIHCKECDTTVDGACPKGHDPSRLTMRLEVRAPTETETTSASDALHRLRNASTRLEAISAARQASELPMHDLDVLLTLLLTDDDEHVANALAALEGMETASLVPRRALLDARLKRVESLADDPTLATRGKHLRARLRAV